MGDLKGLTDKMKNIHLLLTSSSLAEIYVYDTLKERCKATLESVYEVNSSSTFNGMLELVNVQPYLAECWLFVIDYKKVRGALKKNLGIFKSESSVFLIKVGTYKDFKDFMELKVSVNDLYLEVIKKLDVYDLLRGYPVSQKVKDFVVASYYRDPEKVFTLVNELKNGLQVESQRDVVKICGESSGSIQKFAIQLLTDEPKTERFLSRSYKKRVATLCDLCDTFGVRTAYNFLRACINDLIQIKVLYLNGVIYDRIRDLPECYDEKRLARYNYYLKTIAEEVSYTRLLSLYEDIGAYGRWLSSQDGVLFLYKYYLGLLEKRKGEEVGNSC